MKTYDSVIVAKYLLALAYEKGFVLNVTKVQKLLYIAYGYLLAKNNIQLVEEEPKAWPFGPVFPRTRSKVDYSTVIKSTDPSFDEISKDQEVTDALKYIIDQYAGYTASQLSNWSHSKNGPWDRTVNTPGFKWSDPIPQQFIKEYFSQVTV